MVVEFARLENHSSTFSMGALYSPSRSGRQQKGCIFAGFFKIMRRSQNTVPRSGSRQQRVQAMPIYEYRCNSCSHEFETIQKVSEEPLQVCPQCEKSALVKKVSAAGFRLKGGGWYETDVKSGDKRNVSGDKKECAQTPASSSKSSEASSDSSKSGDNGSSKSSDSSSSSGNKSD